MSISNETEFDSWLRSLYKKTGDLTLLVILTQIGERSVTPLCSTYFHVTGEEATWDDISIMFAGSGQSWDGAAFFPTQAKNGGPLDNPTARLRLREIEAKVMEDRMTLNKGAFFDVLGREIKVEPLANA